MDPELIRTMTNTMVHRGPDDEGYHINGPLGLGFRRLSIIDIEGGHQPMSDLEESVWVVFNGEIYNFPELRNQLEGYGHRFRTRSDTEVIVHGYKQWGEKVLDRLNGMFGLAIWDASRKKLVIARDPTGIKLIYYHLENGSLIFGSEIRPILSALPTAREVDPAAMSLFLRFRYTPSPLTIIKGIRKLAPGSKMVVEEGHFRIERWYGNDTSPLENHRKDDDVLEELMEIYRRALKRHLLSDVPERLLLSGGVDSGLLLALMQEQGNGWPTYTVGYGSDFRDDEILEARQTAEFFSARNVSVHLSKEMFQEALPGIVGQLEEPIASSSIVPMYFVCQTARRDVKVALIGQGPDELFGGYRRHLGVHYGPMWRKIPTPFRSLLSEAIRMLPRNETLKRGVNGLNDEDRMRRYVEVFSITQAGTVEGLFQEGQLEKETGDLIFDCWQDLVPRIYSTDELGGFQDLELRSSLPDELLMYADKLSMAHSLEVRVPYLDREVVEFTQRLPARFKVRYGKGKWVHRMVSKKLLPAKVLNRRKKGFAVNVVDKWFSDAVDGSMSDMLEDDQSSIYCFLKPRAVKELLRKHRNGREDYHKILFSLTLMETWLRQI